MNKNTVSINDVHELVGQRCYVDKAKDVEMRITGVLVEKNKITYRCEWFHNGAAYSNYFDSWRITIVE